MILCFPFGMVSISQTARIFTFPLPVRYASSTSLFPRMVAPVGKSGPFTMGRSSSISVFLPSIRLSIILSTPLITSLRLCGGILVDMPTAIPVAPFTRRFGKRAGRTVGSSYSLEKFGMKSTVFLLIPESISAAILDIFASV